MRLAATKKSLGTPDRGEQLRRGRAAAPALRQVFPSARLVKVHLHFNQSATPAPAEQSFMLYPGARSFFAYPCPHGDCDGIYDLTEAAGPALTREQSVVSGSLECRGVRVRDRSNQQACGLCMSYTIAAEHELC